MSFLTPTPGPSLSKMIAEYQAIERDLYAMADANDGEVNLKLDAWLEELCQDMDQKIDTYRFVEDKLKLEAERVLLEAKRWASISDSLDRARERLRERLKVAMVVTHRNEMKGTNWRYVIVRGADAISITDPNLLPEGTFELVTLRKPLKDAIREKLKAGEAIPGVETRESMQLRSYPRKAD